LEQERRSFGRFAILTMQAVLRGGSQMADIEGEINAVGSSGSGIGDHSDAILREIRELRSAIAQRSEAVVVPIATMAPEPYRVLRDIPAVLEPADDGFIATFFDANISTSGDTAEEAVSNLRSLILDVFDYLSSEPLNSLGPEPARQLAVLREFLARTSECYHLNYAHGEHSERRLRSVDVFQSCVSQFDFRCFTILLRV